MGRLTLVTDVDTGALAAYLRACGHDVTYGGAFDRDAVVVACAAPPQPAMEAALVAYADRGGVVVLAGPTAGAWRDSVLVERAGVLPGPPTVRHEIRVHVVSSGAFARLDEETYVTAPLLLLDKVMDGTEVLLSAMWQLADHPVATLAHGIATWTLPVDEPVLFRALHRVVRHALGRGDGPPVRVGMLGYGAIGAEHAAALVSTPGLVLAAVCDRNPSRVAAAREVVPDVHAVADGIALVESDDVDLVVVSTPPDAHHEWAARALAAGKHVVVEKPFCLGVADADELLGLATAFDRVLAVYQNRRWDPDYLALKRVVRSGLVGDVFHLESFVGGYEHPCGYWHSDEDVSGGAVYDWGSHHLDWTLDLIPAEVEWVSATTQKRVWHDVTNADHTRVTIRFAGGAEAEFVHSDLAAARKPKWYVLGTAGAVLGTYTDAPVPTEVPAAVTAYIPDGLGGTHAQEVSIPAAPAWPFHRELGSRLHAGEPMSVTPEGSRRNVAVMEAAMASARTGGRPVDVRA